VDQVDGVSGLQSAGPIQKKLFSLSRDYRSKNKEMDECSVQIDVKRLSKQAMGG
jgi:hypothetical protein